MRKLLAGFILLLLVELGLLVWLVQQLGWWPMVGIMLVGGVVGGSLAKRQGRLVLGQWQRALQTGQPPAMGALEGMLVFASGALFMLPGVLTDVLALLLLWAPVRSRFAGYLRRSFGLAAPSRRWVPQSRGQRHGHGAEIVDTEGEERTEGRAPKELGAGSTPSRP